MYARQPVPAGLARLAAEQGGVVSKEQVAGTGFGLKGTERLLRDQAWQRLARGIYFTAPVSPPWLALAWAGVLVGGDDARLGGLAAAHLHGLLDDPPRVIQVLVPTRSRPRLPPGPWAFHRERPGARLRATVGSPPRLTVEDTVLDLLDDPDADAKAVVHWVTVAVQNRRTTPTRLLRAAEARHFLRHRRLLHHLLTDVAAGVRSPLELDFLRKVERPHGLPVGGRQQRQRSTEIDVLYEEYALLVELDGRKGHEGVGRFRDMRRDNAATGDGLATLRYGWADVDGASCEVAFQVAANLARRGWPGPLLRCDRCRRVA